MADDTVIPANFGGSPFRDLGDLHARLAGIIAEYDGRIPFANVIGVLEILKIETYERQKGGG